MKKDLSAMDLHFLMPELQALEGAKVEQVYEKEEDKGDLLFRLHSKERKSLLRIRLPGLIYVSESKGEFPQSPPGFCTYLRKHLGGSRLAKVEQVGFERIVRCTFERRREGVITPVILFFELFSKGNIIVCDEGLIIRNVLDRQAWAGREVKVREKYLLPPTQTDTPRLSKDDFVERLRGSGKSSAVKALAIDFSLGGEWAEEIVSRSKVEKDAPPQGLSSQELDRVFEAMRVMLASGLAPVKVGDAVYPFRFVSVPDDAGIHDVDAAKDYASEGVNGISAGSAGKATDFSTFSAAIDACFPESTKETKENDEKKAKGLKIDVIIREQTAKIALFEKAAVENRRKGELIFEHYSEVKEILDAIREARKKHSWNEIKDRLKGHPVVKEIEEKGGRIVLDLE